MNNNEQTRTEQLEQPDISKNSGTKENQETVKNITAAENTDKAGIAKNLPAEKNAENTQEQKTADASEELHMQTAAKNPDKVEFPEETTDLLEESPETDTPQKRFPILPLVLGIPILCLLIAYAAGVCYFQSRFVGGTVIDEMDVFGLSIADLEQQVRGYSIQVVQRQSDGAFCNEEIKGADIGLSYSSTEPFQEILQNQNRWLWFLNPGESHEAVGIVTYDTDSLDATVKNLRGFDPDFAAAPADAYITDYDPQNGFQIVEEVQGNQLNQRKTLEAVREAVERLAPEIHLVEADCYEKPAVTTEDTDFKEAFDKLQSYADITITYNFGSRQEVLDGITICGWLQVDGYDIALDQTKVEEYVSTLRKNYDTIFRPRTFNTSYGKEITIKNGDYGFWMDTEQETAELAAMIERGESGERTPVYRQKGASYDAPDYGDTYVEINLTAQHLFLYKDGTLILESDFVSGNVARGYTTPGGIYGLTYKQRNATLTGETYRTPVSYWMPFNNNIGMHDAVWRKQFGGNIYLTNGSHGCINLPYSAAQTIYNTIEKDTPVICYYLPGTEPVPVTETPAEPGQAEGASQPETPVEEPAPEAAPPEPVPAPEEQAPQEGVPQ